MLRDQRSLEAQAYHKWYKLAIWRRIREAQLSRFPLCAMHLERNQEVLATHCDHIDPHEGDWLRFTQGPFQSLCAPCHSSLKQSEEKLGYRKGVDGQGRPLDPAHPWNVTA
jgi:hypothetical protein